MCANIYFVSTGDPSTDTYPDIQTGGSGPIWRLANELSDQDHQISIHAGTYSEPSTAYVSNIKIKKVQTPRVSEKINTLISKIPFSSGKIDPESVSASTGVAFERLFTRLIFSIRSAREISKCAPDVVYLRDRVAGTFPAMLSIPTIHTVKSPDACDFFYDRSTSRHPANKFLFHYKQFLEENIIKNVDWTFVMNKRMEDYFKSKGFSNLSVVSLGVEKDKIQQNNDFSKRENRILYVGRFDENKRPEWIIDAYNNLNHSKYDVHFVGSGQRESYLRRKVNNMNLNESIIFHGRIPREKVFGHMQQATTLVLPSEFESCGNVLIEAMASGCPVISSNTDGAQQLISHQETGLLFDKYNKEELYIQLDKLLSDPELQSAVSQNAIEYIKKNHTVKKIAEQYYQKYKDIYN